MTLTWLALVVSASLLVWSQRSLRALRAAARDALTRAEALSRAAPEGAQAGARSGVPVHVAELNELTIDLQKSLSTPGFVARRAGRAALATGTLVALIQAARNLDAPVSSLAAPLLSFAGGAAAMVVCAMIGRAAEAEASTLRQHWNSLIRRSARDVAIEAPGRSPLLDHAQAP